jgi:cobalt/nickel transport system ATP-binding protein
LLGPNGSGKTTLLSHLLGLLTSEEGVVRVFGLDPARQWAQLRERIGVVRQNVDEQLLMPLVYDDVAFSPRQYGWETARVEAAVEQVLTLLDIEDLAGRTPHSLSGGEKRKVALAGALVLEPELLLLDEPFEGLDPASRSEIVEILAQLSRERGVSIVLSTHDIDAVGELADYCYVLQRGGTIVLAGTPGEVFAEADLLRESNIRPPILAGLFARLGSTQRPLTIGEAAELLGKGAGVLREDTAGEDAPPGP